MLALRIALALMVLPLASLAVLADDKPALEIAAEQAKPAQVWTIAELAKLKVGLKLTWQHDTGVTVAGKPLVKTQVLEITAVDGDTLSWQVTREIVSIEGESVRRDNHTLKLEGTAAEFAEEAALRTLPLAKEATTSDANLQVNGKAVGCKLITHTAKDDSGTETTQKWWFSKDKPGVCARYERSSGGKIAESLALTAMPE
ncbi:MAG: hypothetical protein KF754_08980 [Planctomycetes bacterium]|nr:hypothetical protein [Planctomycetota bacterium]